MENIDIYDVLRHLSEKRRIFIKWRFNLWRPSDRGDIPITEADLIKKIKVKSLDAYKEYEKSEEFKHILSLVLQTREARDLEDMYHAAKERITNNPQIQIKDLELMMKLQKEIQAHYKQAQEYFAYVEGEGDDN